MTSFFDDLDIGKCGFCGGDIVEDEDGTVYCDNCSACLNEEEGC